MRNILFVAVISLGLWVTTILAQDIFGGARAPVEYSVARIDVVPAGLVRTFIVPPLSAMDVGATVQLSVLCEYADGLIGDCGPNMSWASLNPETVSIDGVTGIATGIAFGPATITFLPDTP